MRFFLLFSLLMSFNLYAEQCQPGAENICTLIIENVLPSGKTYKLEISETQLDTMHSSDEEATGYWGANGKIPATHVNTLSLLIDGESISIPSKVYSDLGNLTFAEVKENKAAIVLIVKGGEAAAAYYSTYVFYDNNLRKRTVRSSVHPGEIWEKASFSEPVESKAKES